MPGNEPSILSQSSLQDYVDCPRRFQLRHLDRLTYPALETEPALENEKHQQEGEDFHRLVHQSLLGIPDEKLARLANTPNLARWWDHYIAHRPTLDGYTIYPEVTLSAPLGRFRLVAKYDLLALGHEDAIIYDWKTSRKRPRDEWLSARMQTRVYRALLPAAGGPFNGGRPIGPEQVGMVYWFADFPTEPAALPYNESLFKRDWSLLEKLADEIASAADFPLTDDHQKCLFCPYRSYCNRGVNAGELDQAEGAMEADPFFDVNFEQVGEIEF